MRSAFTCGLALLACFGVSVDLAGCVVWRTEPVPSPVSTTHSSLPARVRITTKDGRQQTVLYPEIRADSLTGQDPDAKTRDGVVHVAIPLSDIATLKARRPSLGRTTLLVVTPIAAYIAIMLAILPGGNDH